MAVHKFTVEEDTNKPSKVVKATKKTTEKLQKQVKSDRKPRTWTKPFRSIGGYFMGAWYELRQVRWPDRKATWGLTIAVLIFSLALGVLIFLLDLGFTYLFKEIIL